MRTLTWEWSPLHRVSSQNGEPSSNATEISGNLGGTWPNIRSGTGRASRKRQQEAEASLPGVLTSNDQILNQVHVSEARPSMMASGQSPCRPDTEGMADCVFQIWPQQSLPSLRPSFNVALSLLYQEVWPRSSPLEAQQAYDSFYP